jgi:tRNA (guanine-N7-)-methyltransferase
MTTHDPLPKPGEAAIFTPKSWTHPLPLEQVFPSERPLEVDIGCGKGRYLVARAAAHPEINILGIDRLLVRLRKAGRKILRLNLANARLLRIEAAYAVEHLLPPGSVSVMTAWFPDPWPKRRHHRRRLFGPRFCDTLWRCLRTGGEIHVATDHLEYLETIRAGFASDPRFETIPARVTAPEERTEFEEMFREQGTPVGRAAWRTRPAPASGVVSPPTSLP